MGDFYGLKKNNEAFNCNDATARSSISLINEKIPSVASSNNKLVDTSAMNTALAGKVDKVAGKGLSTNDYSDEEKSKVTSNAEAIEAMVNVNGCCNVAVHNCQSTTIEGTTFTVNADGSITATAPITGAWQGVASTALFKLKGGVTYKLTSGLPATSGFFMQLRDENGVDLVNTYQVTEATYTPSTDMNCKVIFLIHNGYSMTSDETLYPMIHDARLNPTGYVPYAMTNRELTERVSERYVSVMGDGVKTNQQLLNDLYSLIDATKITTNSRMEMVSGGTTKWYHRLAHSTLSKYEFAGISGMGGSEIYFRNYIVETNLSSCYLKDMILTSGNLQVSDETASVPSNTIEYRLYY